MYDNQQPSPNQPTNTQLSDKNPSDKELLQLMQGSPQQSSPQPLGDEELIQLMQASIAIKDRIVREAGWQTEETERGIPAFRTVLRQWPQDDLKHTLYLDQQNRRAYVAECRYLVPYGGDSADDYKFRYTPTVQVSEEDIRVLMG